MHKDMKIELKLVFVALYSLGNKLTSRPVQLEIHVGDPETELFAYFSLIAELIYPHKNNSSL